MPKRRSVIDNQQLASSQSNQKRDSFLHRLIQGLNRPTTRPKFCVLPNVSQPDYESASQIYSDIVHAVHTPQYKRIKLIRMKHHSLHVARINNRIRFNKKSTL